MKKIRLGKYRHYKGSEYELKGFAEHSETGEKMAVYQACYGDKKLWTRPLSMWDNTVNANGKEIERFSLLDEDKGEITENLFENVNIRVEKIISNGEMSPQDFWYNNSVDEYVMLTNGAAILEFKDKKIELKTSDNYYIKAHEKHRVAYTSDDCVWLCIYIYRSV